MCDHSLFAFLITIYYIFSNFGIRNESFLFCVCRLFERSGLFTWCSTFLPPLRARSRIDRGFPLGKGMLALLYRRLVDVDNKKFSVNTRERLELTSSALCLPSRYFPLDLTLY